MSPPPDQDWLRGLVEELEQIERPSASDGERRAAEWVVAKLRGLGGEARIEAEPAHGTYWWPLGIGAVLGALGGIAALRGRRLLGALLGALGAGGIAADFPPGKRPLRRLLPRRTAYNVLCEIGPADAERTVVIVAHHDAAHPGIVFHPALPRLADRLGADRAPDTSPPLMAPVLAGPVLAALGALLGKPAALAARDRLRARHGRGDDRHRGARGRPRRQRQRHRRRHPAGRGASG